MSYFSTPGIFECLDSWSTVVLNGMVANNSSASIAEQNALVLQAAIDAAQALVMGMCQQGAPNFPEFAATILIPGHSIVPPPVNPSGTGDVGRTYHLALPTGSAATAAININCWWPLRILGTGSTKLVMTSNSSGVWADMFSIQTGGSGSNLNVGGVTFEDLDLSFEAVTGVTTPPAAIHAGPTNGQQAQNVRCVRVVFDDCPIGVWFDNAYQGSMLQCTSLQQSNQGTFIICGNTAYGNVGKEIYVAGCYLSSNNGGTGVNLQGADHFRMEQTRLEGYYQGILINPGNAPGQNVLKCSFVGVTVYTGPNGHMGTLVSTALTIMPTVTGGPPPTKTGSIGDLTFVGCEFEPAQAATDSTGPGILIDEGANPSGQPTIDTVKFIGCTVRGWFHHGLQVNSGRNIEVIGGIYAGNRGKGLTTYGAGIYLGAPTSPALPVRGMRINGAACVGKYQNIQVGNNTTSTVQQVGIYIDSAATEVYIVGCDISKNDNYGVYIDASATEVIVSGCSLINNVTHGVYIVGSAASGKVPADIYIRGCDATSYASYSAAISINGTAGTDLGTIEVTNCAGYNDQGVTVSTTAPATTTLFNGTYSVFTNPYYGPVTFYTANSSGATISHIKLNTKDTNLKAGSFYISAGNWFAEIDYSGLVGAKPLFLMIGQ